MKKHGLMIDMDGVIYTGGQMVDGADDFIKRLLKTKIPFTFLSNNSDKTRKEAVEKLAGFGIEVTEKHIYTSAMATSSFLKDEFPGAKVFVLGGSGLLQCLQADGIRLVNRQPDIVILGEGLDFTLKMAKKAADMIIGGARFIATNHDPSPRKEGWNNLGIAATAAMLEEAAGREAFVVGKPSPLMLRSAIAYMGLSPAQTTIIGDTMETDIIGGLYMGMKTVLVLSGIADKDALRRYGYKPSLAVNNVNDIQFPLPWWKQTKV